jgi:hypothetical protein
MQEKETHMKNVNKRIDQSVKLLRKLKSRLIFDLSEEYSEIGMRRVHQAVNEAESLASQTPVPFLVLPDLAEEKVRKLAAWFAHQQSVLQRGAEALAA